MTIETSPDGPAWYSELTSAQVVRGTPDEASAVCMDSREVKPGAVFVAMPGETFDGNSFIPDAISRGATCVVVQEDLSARWQRFVNEDVVFVSVPDVRIALAEASAGFYHNPARSLGTIGVTGTDGKTTTTHLIAHVLNATNRRAGYLSSVEFTAGGIVALNASHMTTLEAPYVQRQLATIRDVGGKYAVIEASSIGLDMHRVDCCEFDVGVFTNLAPDHLDYHGGMAEYRDAKAILFRMLGQSADKGLAKAAVLNAGDTAFRDMKAATTAPAITYRIGGEADLVARDITPDGFGTKFKARMFGETVESRVNLMGEYNVENCLAAIGVAVSQGVNFAEAVRAVESFESVAGRMELVEEGQEFQVVIDIASTEQAMRNVLRMLRPVTPGRIIVVFGAAGERDKGRRRGIAKAVMDDADYAVITNEDPRGEDPDRILDDIAAPLRAANFRFERELDRRQAIEMAFQRAEPDDTVLLAGKGTEQSIVINGVHWPWDERRIARELLREQLDV